MAKRKRRWGDLPQGRRLRSIDPFNAFTPFIMKRRGDAAIFYEDAIELSKVEEFIKEKRREGLKGFGILHIMIAAYIRVVSQRPALNRFIQGQRIYARNDIEVIMAVKKRLDIEAGETMIKVKFEPADTVYDVYERLNAAVDEIKTGEEDNSTEKAANFFMKCPRLLLRFLVGALKLLDYYGLLPQKLLDLSPFHGSMVITDLGSLGIRPVHHHLYDFGNVPFFVAFGTKRKAGEGENETRYLDYIVTVDERICDGFYFSRVLRTFKTLAKDPDVLAKPPETIVEDID